MAKAEPQIIVALSASGEAQNAREFKISYIEHPKKPSLFLDLILYFLGTHPLVFCMPVFHGIFDGYKTQYILPKVGLFVYVFCWFYCYKSSCWVVFKG
jgi:hypothetical protein